jgi:hypothetical protein
MTNNQRVKSSSFKRQHLEIVTQDTFKLKITSVTGPVSFIYSIHGFVFINTSLPFVYLSFVIEIQLTSYCFLLTHEYSHKPYKNYNKIFFF